MSTIKVTNLKNENFAGDQLYFKSDGKIGIGTADPSHPLHVKSTTSDLLQLDCNDAGALGAHLKLNHDSSSPADDDVVGAIEFNGKDSNGNPTIYSRIRGVALDVTDGSEDGALVFGTRVDASFGERMRINGGNVGIGTSSPSEQLHINSAATTNGLLISSTNNNTRAMMELNGKDSSGNQVELRLGGFGDTNRGEIYTVTNHDVGFATNNAAPQMVLKTSGNVGIGTTSPNTSLEIASTDAIIRLSDTNTSAAANDLIGELQFYSNDADGAHIGGYVKAIQDPSDAYGRRTALLLGTQTTDAQANEKVRIDHLGKVGIGTSSPDYFCEIEGSGGSESVSLGITNTGSDPAGINLNSGHGNWSIYNSKTVGDALEFTDESASAIRMVIDNTGDVKINDGNLVIGTAGHGIDFSATSDAGGSTSELLDDYEEGSWDPAWSNSTGTGPTGSYADVGTYTKIGNIVHLTFSISADGNGLNGATGNIGISGVPFSAYSPNAQGIRGAFGVLGKGYGAPTDLRYCSLRSTNAIRLMLSDHTDVQEDSTGISWSYNCNQISGSLTYRIA